MKRYDMYQDYDMLIKPEEHLRGEWVYYDEAQATIARLTAELDQSRAETAAAYERAAQVADACEKQNRPKVSDYHKGLSSGGQAIAAAIRAIAAHAQLREGR